MWLALGRVEAVGISGLEDWVWALPILYEQGECGKCGCVWVAVWWMMLGVVGAWSGLGSGSWRVVWCYVCVG